MMTPRNHRWTLRSLERRVAPHIDPSWAEAMLLELRLTGVGGTQIGAALAEVDSHCSESGQSADEAFGDPVAYARSLGLPTEDDVSPRALVWSAAPILVQVLGMLLLLPSVSAWRAGELARFSLGTFVSVGLLLLIVAAAIRWIDLLLRASIQHPLVVWAAGAAPLALFIAAQMLLPANALQVPAAWAITASLALLAAGTGWGFALRHSDETDEVVTPLAPSPSQSTAPHLIRALTIGLVPIATVGLVALSWWTTA